MLAAAATTKIAALTVVAALAVAAPAVASLKGGHHAPAPTFGAAAHYVTSLDTDVESGTMKQVHCAAGAQPGARCYVAR